MQLLSLITIPFLLLILLPVLIKSFENHRASWVASLSVSHSFLILFVLSEFYFLFVIVFFEPLFCIKQLDHVHSHLLFKLFVTHFSKCKLNVWRGLLFSFLSAINISSKNYQPQQVILGFKHLRCSETGFLCLIIALNLPLHLLECTHSSLCVLCHVLPFTHDV